MARNKFDIDEELQTEFNVKHLKRVARYIKPFKGKIALTLFVVIFANVTGLISPLIMKTTMDDMIPAKNIKGIILLGLLMLLIIIIGAVCLKIRVSIMSDVGQSIIKNIRYDLFVHLQKLPFTYYDSRPHGKILVRVVNYVNSLSDLLSNGIVNAIAELLSIFMILIFIIVLSPSLTLFALAGVPFLIVGVLSIKNAQRKANQALSRKSSNMNAYIHESLSGMKVTQSFSREEENMGIFKKLGIEYKMAWMRAVKLNMALWPMIDLVAFCSSALVYMGGVVWIQGVSAGVLIAFIQYVWRFWNPIINLANVYNSLINAMAYLERIFETLDEQPIVDDIEGAGILPEITGDVEFENVSFSYDEGHKVLDDVSFKIKAGETVALVGPTGSGKTTIVNLLSRFYDVTDGQVKIDGHNIREVTLESLRSQMGVMLQDTFIFSGNIIDNIRYSRLGASDNEIQEAAKAVKAHDFIVNMPEGYNTQVNERGSRLSAGQRQLISFARALLANPRILILDEATSSIDTRTEKDLQEGLDRLLKGRTSFVIAHRLSTIKNADKIMYINQGKIAEIGTHDELMAKRGLYFNLYTAQYRLLEEAV